MQTRKGPTNNKRHTLQPGNPESTTRKFGTIQNCAKKFNNLPSLPGPSFSPQQFPYKSLQIQWTEIQHSRALHPTYQGSPFQGL